MAGINEMICLGFWHCAWL